MSIADQHTVTLQVAADVKVTRRNVAQSIVGVATVTTINVVGRAGAGAVGIECITTRGAVSFGPTVAQLDAVGVEVVCRCVAIPIIYVATEAAISVVICLATGTVGIPNVSTM